MRLRILRPAVMLAALGLMASAASAQSLGEIARQEEARRAAVKVAARAKVLTNADLAPDPDAGAIAPAPSSVVVSAPPTATAVTAAAGTGSGNDSAAAVTAPPDSKPKEDEAAWRWRAGEIRERLARAQKRLDGFTGTPIADPREQARMDAFIKQVQDELRRAGDAQRLFEMQADAAGIPVAWIK